MVETFGEGAFDAWLQLIQEPWTGLKEDGLLVWAGTEHENLYEAVPAPGLRGR
ncbi:hypothetical protein [Streptomyces xanthophaeus]|uniref:hypothetical protein n=1 Tax=Streptomyces xanthophaeus TaxID=67385 RepID=UPI000B265498|nr:hypothetical protein [Streptomyces xanthophaeus]